MLNEYNPVNSLILIKPLKLKYRTQLQVDPDYEAAKDSDPVKDEMPRKETKVKIKLSHQLAEVISIGNLDAEKLGFDVGDTVVYNYNMGVDFELQKGYKVINSYSIIAKKVA